MSNTLDGTVSRIDPETQDVRTIDVGAAPAGLAFGAGSLWVANSEARTVAQVDPQTEKVLQSIPAGNGPRGVAVGFGAVWVANSLDGTLSRIDLARDEPTRTIAIGETPARSRSHATLSGSRAIRPTRSPGSHPPQGR